jgi:hypothetical protein
MEDTNLKLSAINGVVLAQLGVGSCGRVGAEAAEA